MHAEIIKYWENLGGIVSINVYENYGLKSWDILLLNEKHGIMDVCYQDIISGELKYSFPLIEEFNYKYFDEKEALRIVKLGAFL